MDHETNTNPNIFQDSKNLHTEIEMIMNANNRFIPVPKIRKQANVGNIVIPHKKFNQNNNEYQQDHITTGNDNQKTTMEPKFFVYK